MFSTVGGAHYIAMGMHWLPTDIPDQMYLQNNPNYKTKNTQQYYHQQWGGAVKCLNDKKKEWQRLVKKAPKLYNFLKKEIYTDEN